MAVFKSNKDLDSTLVVIGIHILMGGAMFFHFTGSSGEGVDSNAIMSNLLIAYTGVCSYLFGKGKAEAEKSNGEKQ